MVIKPLKAGHHWHASEAPWPWRLAGGPMMSQHWMLAWFFKGSKPVLLRNPIFLWSLGGGPDFLSPPPPLDPCICLFDLILYISSTIFQLYRDGSSWVEPVLSFRTNVSCSRTTTQRSVHDIKQFGSRSGLPFLLGLIWGQTVYKSYQQKTLAG